jgi:hypothetical protein
LIVLQNEFKQEFLTLKTELKRMKQRNWNMKFAIFGLMLVLVLFFISNHKWRRRDEKVEDEHEETQMQD